MNTSILVVDDDDAHRGMLRMMLQAWGYSVDEAADGDLAVEAVRAKPYDVVLTDVRMGRMDGIHALRGILDYNPALPVVLMTAYSSVETAVEALRLGAYELLHRKDLAAPIVISEAIRLAERFSSAESPRFVNGVLAGISKTERPA